MTRIYEIEKEEFERIAEGQQSFIVLKDDKLGIKCGDAIILQYLLGESEDVSEITKRIDFTLTEDLKKGFVLCALSESLKD